MKYSEAYKSACDRLEKAGIENFEFDCFCLLEKAFGINRTSFFLKKNDDINTDCKSFFDLVERRINREPLQYIIGEWEFVDSNFYVGKGVLIPRQDTELLVEVVSDFIKSNDVKVVFDLCSGSGCIGITLAKHFPHIQVYCFEYSSDALKYLEKNVELNNVKNTTVVYDDIFKGFDYFDLPSPDVIVSNPPYIITDEVLSLQKEVQSEPFIALDGGKDGLDFYRCIEEKWLDSLTENGLCAVECGENQAEDIKNIFKNKCNIIKFDKDLNNIDRVVSATGKVKK